MNRGALWLPDGSVRSIIALILTIGLIVVVIRDPQYRDALVGLATLAVREYFDAKSSKNETKS